MEIGKVSIIVPAYNIAPYLSKCMESIVAQSYKHLQIIVVDDGSSDNTLEIAMTYAGKDERITVITQSNSGVSVARNRGLEEAVGEFVMFVDGDDWLEVNAVEKMVSVSTKYGLDVVRSGFVFENTATNNSRVSCEEKELSLLYGDRILRAYLHGHGIYASVCGGIYRKSFLERYHFVFERGVAIGEDGFFTLQVMSRAESLGILGGKQGICYHVLVRPSSATRSLKQGECEKINKKPDFKEYLKTAGLWDKFRSDYDVWTVRAASSNLCKAAVRMSWHDYAEYYRICTSHTDFRVLNKHSVRKYMNSRSRLMSLVCKNSLFSYSAMFLAHRVFKKALF